MPKHSTHPKQLRKIVRSEANKQVNAAGSGSAAMGGATRAMKKVTGGASVLASMGEEGRQLQLATLQKLEETDRTYNPQRASVPLEIEKAAIVDIAGGASPSMVEAKYEIHAGYVAAALKRRFGSPAAAKLALQGLVLENALACQMVAAEKIDEMSGPQAVMAGAILIDKSIALEKSISEQPKTIDFGALASMAKTLKVLREINEAR